MDELASFGTWMKARRKSLYLTQDRLARELGVAYGTLRKLESDERRPSPELAQRLAELLQVPPAARQTFVRVARAELAPDYLLHIVEAGPQPSVSIKSTATSSQGLLPVSASLPHSTLPRPLTSLIGRAAEVASVCASLAGANVRLLTLTGPGGVGKTRLAIQAATELMDDFGDGVCFVDLAPLRDPSLVLTSIAQALHIRETAERSFLDQLEAFLCSRHLLLVLDNFEQVVAAAPMIDQLLGAAPRLKVLLTSRMVLGVYGEQTFEVPPLALPELTLNSSLEQLAQFDSVRLLVERAQVAKTDFQLTRSNAAAVAEVCQRLDGLPLAIELAAARMRILTPHELLDRLNHRLPILSGGARTLPARQQTLRATLDWSYSLSFA